MWKCLAVATIVIGAGVAALSCQPIYPHDLERTPKAGVLTGALARAYDGNPVRWEREIRGNPVQAQGRIWTINPDGSVMFTHRDLLEQEPLVCWFSDLDDVVNLRRRQTIIVEGSMNRVAEDRYGRERVHLTDCRLAPNP